MYELLPKGFFQTKPAPTKSSRPDTTRQTKPGPSAAAGKTLTKRQKEAALVAAQPAAAVTPAVERAVWPFANITGDDPTARLLLQTFWLYSDSTTRHQMEDLHKRLQLHSSGGKSRTVVIKAEDLSGVAGQTARQDYVYTIPIHAFDDRLPQERRAEKRAGTTTLPLLNPAAVATLADELYTVYQAEVGGQIAYEAITGDNKKRYVAQGYDILDEQDTKIASVIALYNQYQGPEYLAKLRKIDGNSPSFIVMEKLFYKLNEVVERKKKVRDQQEREARDRQAPASADSTEQPKLKVVEQKKEVRDQPAPAPAGPAEQPKPKARITVTLAEVREAFLQDRSGAQAALLAMIKGGYGQDVQIAYDAKNSTFKNESGRTTGRDYLERRIRYHLTNILKMKPSAAYEAEVKQRLADEETKLKEQGVFYRFEPGPAIKAD